jgi:hypothetical protein
MRGELKDERVEAARRDLEDRTLARIHGDFARLVYLAAMRDYNTGEYHHEGLSQRYTSKSACSAIASCHREVFRRLISCSMGELVEELEIYTRSNGAADVVSTWKWLQPFKVLVPLECSALTARFFALNVRTALEVLTFRQRRAVQNPLPA